MEILPKDASLTKTVGTYTIQLVLKNLWHRWNMLIPWITSRLQAVCAFWELSEIWSASNVT
jgi:hypothetical protein